MSMKYRRWLIPILVGLLLFGNHYVRDSVGALEKQMEEELKLTSQDYSNLNALYFFPNIITPLIAGMLTEKLGGVSICFLYSAIIASIGHLIFAIGIQYSNKGLIFLGRGIGGSMYEIVDAMMPITYLGPLFASEFQIVVGFMQIFIRMGSVVNFIASPYIYLHYNLKVAFWVAAAIGMASVPLLVWTRSIEVEYLAYMKQNNDNGTSISGGDDIVIGDKNDINNKYNIVEEVGNRQQLSSSEIELSSSITTKLTAISHNHTTSSSSPTSIQTRFSIVDDDDDDEEYDLETQNSTHNPINSTVSTSSRSNSISNDSDQSHRLKRHLNDTTSITSKNNKQKQSYKQIFLELMPLHKFTVRFYLYLLSGSFLYGSIVPFWFIGSKYMQDNLYLDVVTADNLVAIPEFMVILVGFPVGLIVSKYQFSVRVKLLVVFLSMIGMVAAYSILVLSTLGATDTDGTSTSSGSANSDTDVAIPTIAVTLLGFSFALACSLFWGAINELCTSEYLSAGSGLISCGVNVLPAIVPPVLACFDSRDGTSSNINIIVLAVLAGMSGIFALGAAYPDVLSCCCCTLICSDDGGSITNRNLLHTSSGNGISHEHDDTVRRGGGETKYKKVELSYLECDDSDKVNDDALLV